MSHANGSLNFIGSLHTRLHTRLNYSTLHGPTTPPLSESLFIFIFYFASLIFLFTPLFFFFYLLFLHTTFLYFYLLCVLLFIPFFKCQFNSFTVYGGLFMLHICLLSRHSFFPGIYTFSRVFGDPSVHPIR